jgi:hypothetical protein
MKPKTNLVTTLKVASIPAPFQIALNGGAAAGVKKGDDVVLLRNEIITDPDSGEQLGNVAYTKLMLQVTYVQEKFCIARVTTPVPQAPYSSAKINRVKDVTFEPIMSDSSTTLIAVGEVAKVRRRIDTVPEEQNDGEADA